MDTDHTDTHGKFISREQLLRRLQRVAQVRSLVTMLSVMPVSAVAVLAFGDMLSDGATACVFFGTFFAIAATMTQFYCKRAIRCPRCGESLWRCGTGNFKPRRMRIRNDAHACPHCGARLA